MKSSVFRLCSYFDSATSCFIGSYGLNDKVRATFKVQQVLQQSQSKLEQTEVTAVATMDNTGPAVLLTERTQINGPDVG